MSRKIRKKAIALFLIFSIFISPLSKAQAVPLGGRDNKEDDKEYVSWNDGNLGTGPFLGLLRNEKELQREFLARRSEIERVLKELAGLPQNVVSELINKVKKGEFIESVAPPGSTFDGMICGFLPRFLKDVRWDGPTSLQGWRVAVIFNGKEYSLFIAAACGNICPSVRTERREEKLFEKLPLVEEVLPRKEESQPQPPQLRPESFKPEPEPKLIRPELIRPELIRPELIRPEPPRLEPRPEPKVGPQPQLQPQLQPQPQQPQPQPTVEVVEATTATTEGSKVEVKTSASVGGINFNISFPSQPQTSQQPTIRQGGDPWRWIVGGIVAIVAILVMGSVLNNAIAIADDGGGNTSQDRDDDVPCPVSPGDGSEDDAP